ncbi:(2Fe-2S)-binding protein [Mycobacterium sp. MAA66]|uniref:(2Fe-2S)-binding protein n=1 Tax=Mycobacterium sp. MAA66 TaxID=3156297 RepID=UPI003518B85F
MHDELASFGPFFAIAAQDDSRLWQPMTALVDDPAVLGARVDRVREALAAGGGCDPQQIDLRVAASVAHLGLVARLLAPMIGMAALGRSRTWSLNDLSWQDELGGPFPLSVATEHIVGVPAVEAITEACERFNVSRKVLWGNVGSAANSAAQQVTRARPELSEAARAAADDILADPRVDGGALRSGPNFRRLSCCLIYQLAGDRAACCGDCVLVTAPAAG